MRDSDAYYNYILLRSLYSVLYGYYQHEEFLLRWKKNRENKFEYNSHGSLNFVKVNNPSKWLDLLDLHKWNETTTSETLMKLFFFKMFSVESSEKIYKNMWNSSYWQMILTISLLENNLHGK